MELILHYLLVKLLVFNQLGIVILQLTLVQTLGQEMEPMLQ